MISLQYNRLTPPVLCHVTADIHIEMLKLQLLYQKKPLTSIHVTLRARWYQSASSYLLDLSREALAAKRYTNEQLASNDSWQNNDYADQYISIYHWLRLLSAIDFDLVRQFAGLDIHFLNLGYSIHLGNQFMYHITTSRNCWPFFFLLFIYSLSPITAGRRDEDKKWHENLRSTLEYMFSLNQTYSVILASFYFCVSRDRDEVEVHKNAAKELSQYPAILAEQA